MSTIISHCHEIRAIARANANEPCAATITEAECIEDTLLYVLRLYRRKPSMLFNIAVKKLRKDV